jgi:hypothetical protein
LRIASAYDAINLTAVRLAPMIFAPPGFCANRIQIRPGNMMMTADLDEDIGYSGSIMRPTFVPP